MKKLILSLAVISFLTACQETAKQAGSYSGLYPCADCPGIDTQLVLNADNTYSLTQTYLESPDAPNVALKGKFTVDENEVITLDNTSFPNKFKYTDGQLLTLDSEGNSIEIESENYNLGTTGKVYQGTIPCVTCTGEDDVVLTLNHDKTYTVRENYVENGKDTTDFRKGTYSLSETGALTLMSESDGYKKVKMSQGKVNLLEDSEKEAVGKTAKDYELSEVGMSFVGVIPCADCQGIELTFIIKSDKTFYLKKHYLTEGGKESTSDDVEKGTYTIDNNIVTLDVSQGFKKFQIDADKAVVLDDNGNRIKQINTAYILTKK